MSAPKAYSYIRFSRPEQMRGDSLRRQIAAAEEWAAARGVVIDQTLQDLGVSGFRGKNRTEGALSKFLGLVEAGRIARGSYLIMESLDRMSREAVIEILPRFLDVINAGITIVTLIDRQEYARETLRENWTPLIMSLAVMARSHEESKTKSERLNKVWSKKRGSNDVMTAAVPGWLDVQTGPDGKRVIIENPERVAIVKRIFAETIAGYGRRAITTRLNKEGVPTFGRSRGWQPSYVIKLLNERTVLGELQTWTRGEDGIRKPAREPHVGYYPQVIDEATWARAQAASRARFHAAGRRGPGARHLLLGLLRCGACGARMTRLNKGEPPKGGTYFVCSDAARAVSCTNTRKWRAEEVEQKVIGKLHGHDVERVLNPPEPEQANVVDGLRARIASAEHQRDRWAKAFDDGDDFAADRIKGLRAEIARLKQEMAEASRDEVERASAEPVGALLVRAREIAERLSSATDDEAADLRRRLAQAIRELIVEIRCHPTHVVAVARRRWRRPAKGMSVVPPMMKDGKAVPDWEATITLIDERPPSAEDAWRYVADADAIEVDGHWPRLTGKRIGTL
jgi:DNA invertase Pin-like site-specific DNA recombinase